MSAIKQGQVKTYTTTDGEVFYNSIEADLHQAKLEIIETFDNYDFEYDRDTMVSVTDIATLIKVSRILKKYNQL